MLFVCVFEITLSNLRSEGEIDEKDFMARAKLLCALGQTVMISNFQEYYKVVEYFSRYTKERMGLAMGVNNLVDIFEEVDQLSPFQLGWSAIQIGE